MKSKNYSIIIVSGATSSNKEFVISSKLIRNSIIAFSILLLLFGFIIFDYLTISFDKEKMKRLERDNIKKGKVIEKLASDFKKLEKNLAQMKDFRERIKVATGYTSPIALQQVGSGGFESETIVENIANDLETHQGKKIKQEEKNSYKNIIEKANIITQDSRDVLKDLKFVESTVNEQKERLAHTPAVWPTKGYISDSFGMRTHPITGKRQFHHGLDISTQLGNKIVATADGFVLLRDYSSALGNLIHIDHGFGFSTRYGHLASFNVKEGDRVKRWQVIGFVGNSGASTGPHLHYEVIYMDKPQNPMNYVFD